MIATDREGRNSGGLQMTIIFFTAWDGSIVTCRRIVERIGGLVRTMLASSTQLCGLNINIL